MCRDEYILFIIHTNVISPKKNLNNTKVHLNPLKGNPTKWSNTLKQFVGRLPTNCLNVLDHFIVLAFKGLRQKVLLIYVTTL